MNNLSNSMPAQLPGIEIHFGLKQCVGNAELYHSLLHRFWKDYQHMDETLEKLDGLPVEQNRLLHSFSGAAINLGMTNLSAICQEFKQNLDDSNHLALEPLRRFRKELKRIGCSIKALDSCVES